MASVWDTQLERSGPAAPKHENDNEKWRLSSQGGPGAHNGIRCPPRRGLWSRHPPSSFHSQPPKFMGDSPLHLRPRLHAGVCNLRKVRTGTLSPVRRPPPGQSPARHSDLPVSEDGWPDNGQWMGALWHKPHPAASPGVGLGWTSGNRA